MKLLMPIADARLIGDSLSVLLANEVSSPPKWLNVNVDEEESAKVFELISTALHNQRTVTAQVVIDKNDVTVGVFARRGD